MHDWLISNEALVRIMAFSLMFALVGLAEFASPRRLSSLPRALRWTNNLGLLLLNTLALRLLFPAAAVGTALFVQINEWGLLNLIALPVWIETLVALVALDFAIWLQHVAMHHVPVLWRLHLVHHADPDFDLTTGLRFHPVEIVVSMLIKVGVIVLLGPAVIAVLLFEVILNATSIFNHGNICLPASLDRMLRLFVVTPDMHRVHHSVHPRELNSNFGFNLSVWDRVFRTYCDQPRDGHAQMAVGLRQYQDQRMITRLPGLLTLPFLKVRTDDTDSGSNT